LDWDILQSVERYLRDASLRTTLFITNQDRFLKMLPSNGSVAQCNTCLPASVQVCTRLPRMHVYLDALQAFALKYATKTDFGDYITSEATAEGLSKQDGAYHLMRHLNNINYLASDVVSFEGDIHSKITVPRPTAICACDYDVEKVGGVLVDYKSYGCDSPLGNPNQLKQYLQYWSATPPTRTFEYVFNADKVNLQQAKEKVVNLIKTDPTGFYNANPAFFNRIVRTDGSGFNVINSAEFQVELIKTNFWQNFIFDFVSITP
jgi:hypothetical protein